MNPTSIFFVSYSAKSHSSSYEFLKLDYMHSPMHNIGNHWDFDHPIIRQQT